MPLLALRPSAPTDQRFELNTDSAQARGLTLWLPLIDGSLRARTGHVVTPTAAPVMTGTPVVGRAPVFNGSSQALTVAVNLSGFSKLAVSLWLYWDAFADDDDLAMELTPNVATTNGWFLDPNSSRSAFEVSMHGNAGFSTSTFTRPSAAIWHHYVVNLDYSAASAQIDTIYVDGVAQTQTRVFDVQNNGPFTNDSLYLMSRAATSLFAAGKMADLRIYGGKLLTAQEAWRMWSPQTRWELYLPAKRRTWFAPVAAGGATVRPRSLLTLGVGS